MTEQVTLPAFEGRNVTEAAVRVVHAGDGLSAALEVDPRPLGLSDEAAYVLIGTVVDVSHRTKDGKVVRELQKGYRLHDKILRPSAVAVGNGEPVIAEQAEEPETAKEKETKKEE